MTETAQLRVGEATVDLPVERGTDGQPAVNIATLLKSAGVTTLDYGFANTAATRSAITFLDGDAGILRYRGYPIEQLAERSTFLEVAYLLIHGELPTAAQLEAWTDEIRRHTLIHEEFKRIFDAFPKDAHPMAILASAVAALSTFYQDSEDPHDPAHVHLSTIRLLAKLPTIAAYAYKKSIGQPFIYPDNALEYEANFLRMMFAVPAEPYRVDPDAARALRVLLILHADHEQNCSTSTVRLVGSSHANLFVSVSAGIAALWGPLHGGANQEVIEMLQAIAASGGDVRSWVERAKRHEGGFRLFGFGHRVYRNYDPRARIIKDQADIILAKLGRRDELLDIARRLEDVALSDPYFIERKLYPNVDFYSGLIYRALGFPVEMFTVLFAIGRLPGWIAHWREMMTDPDTRIGRPRQLYVGPRLRDYVALEERG
ncbi:MAG TPA: citrate synthase [Candidatus Limnocylindrales bacterium]|jgi:citrate synthase|nr:citrate synthase [Candidatus Limnocylindrales bacterium]